MPFWKSNSSSGEKKKSSSSNGDDDKSQIKEEMNEFGYVLGDPLDIQEDDPILNDYFLEDLPQLKYSVCEAVHKDTCRIYSAFLHPDEAQRLCKFYSQRGYLSDFSRFGRGSRFSFKTILAELNGQIVEIESDRWNVVKKGTMHMSKLLRELTGLEAGNDVVLKPYPLDFGGFTFRRLVLDITATNPFEKRMLVDCDKLRKTFHDVYDGKVLTERQSVRLDFKADTITATISSIERSDMRTTTRRLSEEEEENDGRRERDNPDSLASQVKELRRKAEEKKRSDSFSKFIRSRDDRRGLVLTTTVLDFDTRDVNVIKLKNATTPRPKRVGTQPSESSWGAGSIDLSERVGGMNKQINEIFRRVFASRDLHPDVVTKLKIRHTRGMLLYGSVRDYILLYREGLLYKSQSLTLGKKSNNSNSLSRFTLERTLKRRTLENTHRYGPPGTGKTLIATVLADQLNAHEPLILSGPEVFSQYVGQSGAKIRQLFEPAEKEWEEKGNASKLHVIIIDEIDAMCKNRSSQRGDAGSNDQVVNQLLAKMDGVNSLNNVLMIGMTNRLEEIDQALLRPGRFEVKVLIGIPDENGRGEILNIHTKYWKENGSLAPDVSIAEIASKSKNFTGAELKGLCNAALSHALMRISTRVNKKTKDKEVDPRTVKPTVTMEDFRNALGEIVPIYGSKQSDLQSLILGWIGEDISPKHKSMHNSLRRDIDRQRRSSGSNLTSLSLLTILFEGERGSGKTAISAYLALRSGFPFARVVSFARDFAGLHEHQQAMRLREVFEEAYKSKWSVIILDDVENLVHLSAVVGSSVQYSNTLLLTLCSLVRTPPPVGHRLCVVGTTSQLRFLQALQVTSAFQTLVHVPKLFDGGCLRRIIARKLPRTREGVAKSIVMNIHQSGGISVKSLLSRLERMGLDNEIPTLEKWLNVANPHADLVGIRSQDKSLVKKKKGGDDGDDDGDESVLI